MYYIHTYHTTQVRIPPFPLYTEVMGKVSTAGGATEKSGGGPKETKFNLLTYEDVPTVFQLNLTTEDVQQTTLLTEVLMFVV